MSTNKFVKKQVKENREIGEGTRFHELVTKISVGNTPSSDRWFQEILRWVKGNRYLRVIQRKDK